MANYFKDDDVPVWWLILSYIGRGLMTLGKFLTLNARYGWPVLVFLLSWFLLPAGFYIGIVLGAAVVAFVLLTDAGREVEHKMRSNTNRRNFRKNIGPVLEAARITNPDGSVASYSISSAATGFDVEVRTPLGTTDKQLREQLPSIFTSALGATNVIALTDTPTPGYVSFRVLTDDPIETALTDVWPSVAVIESGPTSAGTPVPIALDDSGEVVSLPMWANTLLGAGMPGHGKSVALWEVALQLANDPSAYVVVIDLKEGLEFHEFGSLRADYFAQTQEEAGHVLSLLQEEIRIRLNLMKEQGLREVKPDTPGMGPIVILVDELAELFAGTSREEKQRTEKIMSDFTRVLKLGRAAGLITVAFTQRTSAEEIGGGLRDLFGFRWSMRVASENSATMILGSDAVNAGATPHLLPNKNAGGAGLGFLVNELQQVKRCRSWYVEPSETVRLSKILGKRRKQYLQKNPLQPDQLPSQLITPTPAVEVNVPVEPTEVEVPNTAAPVSELPSVSPAHTPKPKQREESLTVPIMSDAEAILTKPDSHKHKSLEPDMPVGNSLESLLETYQLAVAFQEPSYRKED